MLLGWTSRLKLRWVLSQASTSLIQISINQLTTQLISSGRFTFLHTETGLDEGLITNLLSPEQQRPELLGPAFST